MARHLGLTINRGQGGGGGTITGTDPFTRSSGITTDSNNNIIEVTSGENSYRYIYYNAVGLITGFTEDIGGESKGWKLEYNSQNLVTNITEQNPTMDPSYSINSNGSVNEGSNITINFETTGVNLGDTYYWTIETNAGDFATTSGSFTHSSNPTGFVVQPTEDYTAEGAETFTVAVRSGSTSGTILATSSNITINDTSTSAPPGQQNFTSTGSQSWTVPTGVGIISILCIGGGAGGAGGGASGYSCCGAAGGGGAWKNNVSVTPGETLTITVGNGGSGNGGGSGSEQPGGDGGDSKVERSGSALCHASGAKWQSHSRCNAGNVVVGDGGGLGGSDYTQSGQPPNSVSPRSGTTGGAWGNGNMMQDLDGNGNFSGGGGGYGTGGGGGGVGLSGNGAFGQTGTSNPTSSPQGRGTYDIINNVQVGSPQGGQGRNGGGNGGSGSGGYWPNGGSGNGGSGGSYGGGGGGGRYGGSGGSGGQGVVRIIWYGGRSFPNNHQ